MYAIYGNIYHQYTPNVSIYTIHGSYGYDYDFHFLYIPTHPKMFLEAKTDKACPCAPIEMQTIQGILEAKKRCVRHLFGDKSGDLGLYTLHGYGSIPIHTIFRGMNIHLPAILMFTRGIGF